MCVSMYKCDHIYFKGAVTLNTNIINITHYSFTEYK